MSVSTSTELIDYFNLHVRHDIWKKREKLGWRFSSEFLNFMNEQKLSKKVIREGIQKFLDRSCSDWGEGYPIKFFYTRKNSDFEFDLYFSDDYELARCFTPGDVKCSLSFSYQFFYSVLIWIEWDSTNFKSISMNENKRLTFRELENFVGLDENEVFDKHVVQSIFSHEIGHIAGLFHPMDNIMVDSMFTFQEDDYKSIMDMRYAISPLASVTESDKRLISLLYETVDINNNVENESLIRLMEVFSGVPNIALRMHLSNDNELLQGKRFKLRHGNSYLQIDNSPILCKNFDEATWLNYLENGSYIYTENNRPEILENKFFLRKYYHLSKQPLTYALFLEFISEDGRYLNWVDSVGLILSKRRFAWMIVTEVPDFLQIQISLSRKSEKNEIVVENLSGNHFWILHKLSESIYRVSSKGQVEFEVEDNEPWSILYSNKNEIKTIISGTGGGISITINEERNGEEN